MSQISQNQISVTDQFAVQNLQQRSAQILDGDDLTRWPDLFVADGHYQLQSRENFAAGWPLCVMDLTSQAMLRDRIYAAEETLFHAPYSQCHVCSLPLVRLADKNINETADLYAYSTFIVTRVQRDAMPQTLCTGRYFDALVWTEESGARVLKFAKRQVIFDNDLLPNSIIKPV